MKTLVESVLILMSPGSLPNQLNSQGANWSATPISRRISHNYEPLCHCLGSSFGVPIKASLGSALSLYQMGRRGIALESSRTAD